MKIDKQTTPTLSLTFQYRINNPIRDYTSLVSLRLRCNGQETSADLRPAKRKSQLKYLQYQVTCNLHFVYARCMNVYFISFLGCNTPSVFYSSCW